MKCNVGQLQAYLDQALPPAEGTLIEQHLQGCAACRAQIAELRRQNADLAQRLATLDPPHVPNTDEALARFQARVEGRAARRRPLAWVTNVGRSLKGPRWRPLAVGLTALFVVVALFSLALVRQAAAEFLGVFRVRKFAVIPVDAQQVERLQELENLLNVGALGEPTFLREPGEPQAVADAVEAAALAGYPVRVPTALPKRAVLDEFVVAAGPMMYYEVEQSEVQALLALLQVEGVTLPPVDPLAVEAAFPTMVWQEYQTGQNNGLVVLQMPSPEVTLPPGIEPEMLGQALLQFLGMAPEEAAELAQNIDWASTLVIPLPTDVAQFREVEVDGVLGLLLESSADPLDRQNNVALWQRDGFVYAVLGYNVSNEVLLKAANSLR